MKDAVRSRVRFGTFDLDLRAGELRDGGRRVVLQEQPFQILVMLVEHEGGIVTRDDVKKKLWPNDTIVEFDHSINAAIKNLRRVLDDSAENPKYVETVARRGYRLRVPVEWISADADSSSGEANSNQRGAAVRVQHYTSGLIGKRVSHYRVLEVVGGGGMGLVYKAEDLKLGRSVAVKFLPEELASDPVALQRFEREARTASSLNHPNICTIYEIEEHEGQPFIVMELLEGQTLRDRLGPVLSGTKALPPDELLDIAIQIASGLETAHQKRIIHRDIKPANIFLTTLGQVKIVDFGLAKSATVAPHNEAAEPGEQSARVAPTVSGSDATLTRAGQALGTAGYMSPEQVRGEKLDARTDIFSFGLVIYQMATGQRAFSGDTAAVVHDAIVNQTPIPPHELNSMLPPKLEGIINRALEKDRERRYQSAEALRSDLNLVLSTQLSSDEVTWKRRGNKQWMAAAAVALVALASVAGAIYKRTAAANGPGVDVQNMKLTRITDNGDVGVTAISPDGRFVAYSLRTPQQSLWMRQMASESTVEVVPPSAEAITGVTFSPDGNYLYFVRDDNGYEVPALGGTPRLIIRGTFGAIGVSPDGKQLAFVHGGSAPKSQLIVVDPDGTNEHVIAQHSLSSDIYFNTVSAPSWSPDGKLIAMPSIHQSSNELDVYPAKGGPPDAIPLPGFCIQALWLPKGDGLLVAINSSYAAALAQVWLLPYPKGEMRRLTNDLDGYRSLSVSADGRLVTAVQVQELYTIFVASASRPGQGTAIRSGKSDGIGLAWMSNGTLLSQNVLSEFWSLALDGKHRTLLFKDDVFPGGFSVCNDGHFIIQRDNIWRRDASGRDLKQITEGIQDMGPDCSADSQAIIYVSQWRDKYHLMKLPINGGVPRVLSKEDNGVNGLRYSPAGEEIADLEGDEKNEILVIRNARTGEIKRSFNLPSGYGEPWNSVGWTLHWTPDGQRLTYARWKGQGTPVNLWSQPLSGGPPRQITNFPDAIVAYDWSPDGKQLALTRNAQSRDVVLISNFH